MSSESGFGDLVAFTACSWQALDTEGEELKSKV
jgi:hypothetical protein